MLKGKSVIELTDVHTGKKERYEDTNLVTEAAMDVLNCNIKGMLYNNTAFNGSNGDDGMLPLKKNIMGGILLYQNALEERADNIYAPLNNPLIGYASDDANNTEDIRRGSRNLTESKEVDAGTGLSGTLLPRRQMERFLLSAFPTRWPEKELSMLATIWYELVPGR